MAIHNNPKTYTKRSDTSITKIVKVFSYKRNWSGVARRARSVVNLDKPHKKVF